MVHLAFKVIGWDPSQATLSNLLSNLTDSDRERFNRFHFKIDRLRFLAGQIIIRKLLVDLLISHQDTSISNIPPTSLVIARTDIGKPYLSYPKLTPPPQFNISHHGDWVMGSSDPIHRIGVDVSKVELNPRSESIFTPTAVKEHLSYFQDNFTDLEWTYIRHPDALITMHAFSRMWCLKESYIKGVGVGLQMELRRMEFRLKAEGFGRDGRDRAM
ncbi:4'-phosphopantetheinyl transferase superfamily [Chytridium lagenaria]|nr:4'-phosphopantetheinyl transferase superfamily [Chytridium lagenaria]